MKSELDKNNVKYCSKCGAKNKFENKSCEHCGLPFKSEKLNSNLHKI